MKELSNNIFLDEKDSEILRLLIDDARIPYSMIATKVSLSTPAVANRIRRLEEQGIIKDYKLIINHKAFPHEEFDIYYKLSQVSEFTVKHVMKYLIASPYTTQVINCIGSYDIRCTVLAKNSHHLSEILCDIESNFLANIKERLLLVVLRKFKATTSSFISSILGLGENDLEPLKEVYKPADTSLDSTDIKIIMLLSGNPRMSFKEISKELSITPEAVSHRVRSLTKREIITGYTTLINGLKLGFRWAVLLLRIRELSSYEHEEVSSLAKTFSHVTGAASTLGDYNLSITFFGRGLNALREVEITIRNSFGDRVLDDKIIFIISSEKYPSIAQGILNIAD